MRSVISYLTIYENREKIKKYLCWVLILAIVIVPYVSPKQYDLTTSLAEPERRITPVNTVKKVSDDEMTVDDAHSTCLKYLYDYFRDYQLSRFIYRNNTLQLWVYNDKGIKNYNDVREIAKILKIRYPNKTILVVLVKDNNSKYAMYEYRM